MVERVRAFSALGMDDIRRLAREQAESGDDCVHGFDAGTSEAVAWERNYTARRMELDTPDMV